MKATATIDCCPKTCGPCGHLQVKHESWGAYGRCQVFHCLVFRIGGGRFRRARSCLWLFKAEEAGK